MKKQHGKTENLPIVVARIKDYRINRTPAWRSFLLLILVAVFSAGLYSLSQGKEMPGQRKIVRFTASLSDDAFFPLNEKTTSRSAIMPREMNKAFSELSDNKQQHRLFSDLQHFYHKLQRNNYYFVTASLMTAFISVLTGLFTVVKYIKEKKFSALKSNGERIVISSTFFKDALEQKKSFNGINWKFRDHDSGA